MKKIKVIFFSTLLLFSIAYILGNDFIRYIDNLNYSTETNCLPPEDKSCITSEPSIEEEHTIICYSISKVTLLSIQENVCYNDSKLPVKLYFSIWLPPDNC